MRYWACLYLEDTQHLINAGVKIMMQSAIKILEKQRRRRDDEY
jgi:hypothetical protein